MKRACHIPLLAAVLGMAWSGCNGLVGVDDVSLWAPDAGRVDGSVTEDGSAATDDGGGAPDVGAPLDGGRDADGASAPDAPAEDTGAPDASVSLVAHTNATTSSAATVTTVSIDTTGATLIVAACGWYNQGATACTITDSAGNPWQLLAAYQGANADVQASYTIGPSTSAQHTFTATTSPSCSGCFADVWVLAFGGAAGSVLFDTSCGSTATASPVSSCGASITNAHADDLLVAFLDTNDAHSALAYSIDTGFTLVDHIATPSNLTEGGGDAYRTLGPSTPFDPTWAVTGNESDFATTLVAFRH